MKKKRSLIITVMSVVFLAVVSLIALRYNVYPYLFCGPNHSNRTSQGTYVCVDSEGMEVGTVCVDVRLGRFSRYYHRQIYDGGSVGRMSDVFLADKEDAKLNMMSRQIQGGYIADSGRLANRFSYVVLQDGHGALDVYVDLGECYWFKSFNSAEIAKEFFNTCTVTATFTGEEASEVEEYVLWK